jgi:hypothetical protein|tara:strand:- start:3844 stop:4062 length:219 start_codon:yes stop_codon:yes gene_type:complete
MGLIFKDIVDDQQESMMKTMHIGNTWEFRYFKLRAFFYGAVSTVTGITATAITDYCIYKFTEYSGIIGWLLA